MLSWRDIGLRYGERVVFSGWSEEVAVGERVVLRGASGSGKSTLLRMVLGLGRPDGGEVVYRGRVLDEEWVWQVRREVGWVPQQVEMGSRTVREEMGAIFDFELNRVLGVDGEQMAEELGRLGLGRRVLDQALGELSGGERQRMALATAFLLQRRLYLLDEPTSALDEESRGWVRQRLGELGEETTVVLVAHQGGWGESYREVWLPGEEVQV